MALSKEQARSLIVALLDDDARRIWTPAALDVLTQTTIDELWSDKILDFAPWYASQTDEVIADESGLVDLTSNGQLSRRFYKLQKLTHDSMEYAPTSPRSFVLQGGLQVTAPDSTYAIVGKKLYGFPLESGCTYEVMYNFLPTAFTSLVETADVDWPDGFENAFAFKVAARGLVKAAPAVGEKYEAIAAESLNSLMSKIKREYVGPAVMQDAGDPVEVGST